MRDYTQLTSEEGYQIEALLKADHNQTEIAAVLKLKWTPSQGQFLF